jgi:hypothetical protein
MAVVSVLSGKVHLSKRQVEELLADLLGIDVSLGTVSKTEERVSEALEQPVEQAKAYVQEQAVVHADETGHKVAGKKAWVWTAVTSLVSVFLTHVSPFWGLDLRASAPAATLVLLSAATQARFVSSDLRRPSVWRRRVEDPDEIADVLRLVGLHPDNDLDPVLVRQERQLLCSRHRLDAQDRRAPCCLILPRSHSSAFVSVHAAARV